MSATPGEAPFTSVYSPSEGASGASDVDMEDIMEQGLSKELLNDELYFPAHPSRDWIRCHVVTTENGCFRMFLEGKKKVRFLLSAKQFLGDSTFYISAHEDFPDLDELPLAGYVARLEQQRDRSYLMNLNHCHLCDLKFGHYNCGRGPLEREIIAKINHATRRFSVAGRSSRMEYRSVEVTIPAISKTGKRKVWCPRSFRSSNPALGNDVDVNGAIQQDRKMCQEFVSKAPEWNNDAQTLVVRFQGNRVLMPSAKNLLLIPREDLKAYSRCDPSNAKQYQQYLQEQVFAAGAGSPVGSPPTYSPSPHVNPHLRKRVPPPQSCYTPQVAMSDISVVSDSSAPKSNEGEDCGSVMSRFSAHTTHTTHSAHSERSEGSKASSGGWSPALIRERMVRTDSVGSTGSDRLSRDLDAVRRRDASSRANSGDFEFIGDGNFRAALQFGKASPTKFVMDFKYPLSPIQAFGITLTSFAAERASSNATMVGDLRDL